MSKKISKKEYERRLDILSRGGAEADHLMHELGTLSLAEQVTYMYPHRMLWPHEVAKDLD